VGTAVPFIVDTLAGKITSARVLGVFFAFDPLLGTLVGALVLEQLLAPQAIAGIVLVALAGAGIVWSAGRRNIENGHAHREPRELGETGSMSEQAPEAGVESVEIERKYEVPVGARLPSTEKFAARGLRVGEVATYQLHA